MDYVSRSTRRKWYSRENEFGLDANQLLAKSNAFVSRIN
jgi:hypothetical protein